MKYVKAENVFPKSLLDEIQKYVQGELVYIPKPRMNYKRWGEGTGTREFLKQRNEEIINGFKSGISIYELADLYYLSEETIRKIVYRKTC